MESSNVSDKVSNLCLVAFNSVQSKAQKVLETGARSKPVYACDFCGDFCGDSKSPV